MSADLIELIGLAHFATPFLSSPATITPIASQFTDHIDLSNTNPSSCTRHLFLLDDASAKIAALESRIMFLERQNQHLSETNTILQPFIYLWYNSDESQKEERAKLLLNLREAGVEDFDEAQDGAGWRLLLENLSGKDLEEKKEREKTSSSSWEDEGGEIQRDGQEIKREEDGEDDEDAQEVRGEDEDEDEDGEEEGYAAREGNGIEEGGEDREVTDEDDYDDDGDFEEVFERLMAILGEGLSTGSCMGLG